MNDFHFDQSVRLDNQRCAGIIIRGNELLMMHRIKDGYEYYVFIGGHRRQNENKLDTLVREISEESSIQVKDITAAFEFNDYKQHRFNSYFICTWDSGTPTLGGEEALKNSKDNAYSLQWVQFEKFNSLNVLPTFAKHWVLEVLINKN